MGLGAALDLAVNVSAHGSSTEADKPKKGDDGLCWAGGDMLNCLKVTHICPHPDFGAGSLDTMYLFGQELESCSSQVQRRKAVCPAWLLPAGLGIIC